MNKSEAIRLAEWAEWFLRNVNDPEDFRWKHMAKSTTELRRLHQENQELLESLKAVTAHLDRICTHTEDYVVIVAAEKVIKKIEGAKNA